MYKMIKALLSIFSLTFIVVLISCDENPQSKVDLSNVIKRDHTLYKQVYKRCNDKNNTIDCNCVANLNIQHRSEIYASYIKNYKTVHRQNQQMEISKRKDTIIEKTKNLSDERVIEALEDDLHRLENSLESGPNSIKEFNLYILPKGKTDICGLIDP